MKTSAFRQERRLAQPKTDSPSESLRSPSATPAYALLQASPALLLFVALERLKPSKARQSTAADPLPGRSYRYGLGPASQNDLDLSSYLRKRTGGLISIILKQNSLPAR